MTPCNCWRETESEKNKINKTILGKFPGVCRGQFLCLLLKPENDNRWDPNEQSADNSGKTGIFNLSQDDVVSL